MTIERSGVDLAMLCRGLVFTGDLRLDAPAFLQHHHKPRTATHSAEVATEARRLAQQFVVDEGRAERAAWLHDISAVIPGPERAGVARALGVLLLPEEEAHPPIAHQKLSVVLARELFGVADPDVLSAIGCHTSLRAGASPLDTVVFLADKVAWDQPGVPPYREELLTALGQGGSPMEALARGALVYLTYLWERRASLPVVHPWMVQAYLELSGARC